LIVPSCGSYHGFLDSGLLLIDKLLKQGLPVATLKLSLYLCHKWRHQCSVCRFGVFKFAHFVPCCDVRYDSHIKAMCDDSGHVLFVSFVFIFVYWCSTRFMWCSICWSFRSTPACQWGSCCSIISFLCNVLWIVVWPFGIFLLSFVLCILLWFTTSDYPFGIFKLFSLKHVIWYYNLNNIYWARLVSGKIIKVKKLERQIIYRKSQKLKNVKENMNTFLHCACNKDIQNVCLIGEWCWCILFCCFLNILLYTKQCISWDKWSNYTVGSVDILSRYLMLQ
jgi:hypothetical protein